MNVTLKISKCLSKLIYNIIFIFLHLIARQFKFQLLKIISRIKLMNTLVDVVIFFFFLCK